MNQIFDECVACFGHMSAVFRQYELIEVFLSYADPISLKMEGPFLSSNRLERILSELTYASSNRAGRCPHPFLRILRSEEINHIAVYLAMINRLKMIESEHKWRTLHKLQAEEYFAKMNSRFSEDCLFDCLAVDEIAQEPLIGEDDVEWEGRIYQDRLTRPIIPWTTHRNDVPCVIKYSRPQFVPIRDQELAKRLRLCADLLSLNRKVDTAGWRHYLRITRDDFIDSFKHPLQFGEVMEIVDTLRAKALKFETGLAEEALTYDWLQHEELWDPNFYMRDSFLPDESNIVYKDDCIVFGNLRRDEIVRPEMMEEPHGCEGSTLEQQQTSNVILMTHAEESVAQPIEIGKDIWENLCSPQSVQVYKQLMSRWQQWKTIRWSADDIQSKLLMGAILPKQFVSDKVNTPNCIMFKQYAFFKSDLEIKIVVNSNKFHCGSLQASFYYGATTDKYYKDRENVFSASQMTHCVIDAASASDGIIKVPYRYYKPLMATSTRSDDSLVLDMGTLKILVLNSLKVPKDQKKEVDVTIFVRFIDPSFSGMKPRDLGVSGEMMAVKDIVNTTANLVNQIYPDPQRDNPTDILPAKPMVPWSAHSWCIGDHLPEPTNPLRLQASGNTPHPPGTLPKEPEMDIAYIKNIFGLLQTVEWSIDDVAGKNLIKIPFSPSLDKYPKAKINNGAEYSCDIMPPVSVISEFFAYWRGSLQYRLDFIATQFHTGRLIIAYLPRIHINNDLTIEQLTACDHIIFDLREERQLLYTNSFLSDKPWYARRSLTSNTTELYPPGYIYIAVINQLTATSAVSPKIEFNVYIRGGEDFELHVPVNPRIGLSYNTRVEIPKTVSITYLDEYGPPIANLYMGGWHTVSDCLVFRYGATSDHITQFDVSLLVAKKRVVYRLVSPSNFEFTHPSFPGKTFQYLVLFGDGTYCYGAPFTTFAKADTFSTLLHNNIIINSEAIKVMEKAADNVSSGFVPSNIRYLWEPTTSLSDFEIVSEAGEERSEVCGSEVNVQKKVSSTNNGILTFGEKIDSIKQLCRRYQPYAFIPMRTDKKRKVKVDIADLILPLMPQGLDLVLQNEDKSENVYGNRIRDGPIPLLASGYRFFRGDMRLRIVTAANKEGNVWVQHRPEYALKTTQYSIPKDDASSYFQPGYATFMQTTDVNKVIEIEVPFYLPGMYGLLQRPDLTKIEDAVHYSMGSLYLSFDNFLYKLEEVMKIFAIFYSISDNMSFSVFQGYPPMINLEIFDRPIVRAEGPIDWMKEKIDNKLNHVAKTAVREVASDVVNESVSDLLNKTDDNQAGIADVINSVCPEISTEKKSAILSMFSNLIHCSINPSIKTIAWSIASIFVQMGLFCMSFIEKICCCLRQIMLPLFKKSRKSETDAGAVQAESPDEDLAAQAAYASTCVAGILALTKCKTKEIPKSIPNFAAYLYDGIPKFTLTCNGLFTFMKNNLAMFKKIWCWLLNKINKDYILETELLGADEEIVSFLKQIQFSLDARNSDVVRYDPVATNQVYELANRASAYLAARAVSTAGKSMPIFDSYMKRIISLRDTLTNEMRCPNVRFEPFVISFNGASDIGKSHMAQTVAKELLTSINYKTYSELIFTRTPGVAYWNGLKNQPVCLFDDFLNIEDSQFALMNIGELFCLKSKAVFNPPMAAIEEKKLRYNPLIVLLCNNKAFPEIAGVGTPEAWMRRRDILVEAIKIEKYKDVHVRAIPKEVRKVYGHLRFARYVNPAGRTNEERDLIKDKDGKVVLLTYEELLANVCREFNTFFQEECLQYDQAIKAIKRFYPITADSSQSMIETVLSKIEGFNKDRVNATGKDNYDDLMERLNDLHKGKYIDDMSKYVKKQIIEKKAADLTECMKGIDAIQIRLDEFRASSSNLKLGAVPKRLLKDLAEAEGPNTCVLTPVIVKQSPVLQDFASEHLYPHLDMPNYDRWEAIKGLVCPCANEFWSLEGFRKDGENRLWFVCDPLRVVLPHCRNGGGEVWVALEGCTCEDSAFGKDEFIDYLWSIVGNEMYEQRSFLPSHLAERCPYGNDTIPIISAATIDEIVLPEALEEEVKDRSWLERVKEKMPSYWSVLHWIIKLSLIIGGIGALMSIGFNFFNSFDKMKTTRDVTAASALKASVDLIDAREEFKKKIVLDSAEEGYSKGTVGVRAHSRVLAKSNPVKAVQQASEQQEQVIYRKLRNNAFFLYVDYVNDYGNRSSLQFRCLGIYKNYALVVDHYLFKLRTLRDMEISFVRENVHVVIGSEWLESAKFIQDSALVIVKLPPQIPQFMNIVKFFSTESVVQNLAPAAKLYEYSFVDSRYGFELKSTFFNRVDLRARVDVTNDDSTVTKVSACFAYEKSGKGLCGSVLVSEANTTSPILGIHVAGLTRGGEGYAEALNIETFAHLLLPDKEPVVQEESAYHTVNDTGATLLLNGNVHLLGAIPTKDGVYSARLSRLVNTECVDAITKSTYSRPVLSDKDERVKDNPFSPLLEGCKHHTNPILPMESVLVKRAIEDVRLMILSQVAPQRLKIGKLSVEEAVCGIKDNGLYEAMAMDTSEGFPWILDRPRGAKDKSWMFDQTLTSNGLVLNNVYSPLMTALEEKEKKRRDGFAYQTVFTDCLKDAKMPNEKVLEPGKTRIFSISPVDFTIQVRQFTMDFVVAYQNSRFKTEHAIGIDIHSREANTLVEWMMTYGDYHVCGDYSKFGDTLASELVLAVYEIICDWYEMNGVDDKSFMNVIRCFARETSNAVHLLIDLLYQCMCGMPSGNPLTVIINSIVNSLYVRIAWQKIMMFQRPDLLDMKSFNDNVRMVTYGDDLWMVVKFEVIHLFNAQTLHLTFGSYGIKFTNATKGDEIIPYSTLLHPETSFLKCTFAKHEFRNNLWVAKLDKRSVEEICNWTWSTQKDLRLASVEACKAMLESAHGHGSVYYEQLRKKVCDYWAKKGVRVIIPDWKAIDDRIYN